MNYSPSVYIALVGWVPLVMLLFCIMSPRRAVVVAFIGAWLFLPMAGLKVQGLPDWSKMFATCVGVLLAAAVFDVQRLLSFRFKLIDMPALIWCICPGISSLMNNDGPYDAMSQTMYQTVTWGLPYFIGRVYFSDLAGMKELAIGVFIGGLIYVPLCLYEVRMSPQWHNMVYGYHAHSFAQTMRMGGWRPTVFMQHGLMVGMWMITASLVGVWLWWSGVLKKVWVIPAIGAVLAVLITAVLCKSLGALVLLAGGLGVLVATRLLKMQVFALVLIVVPLLYIGLRAPGYWDGGQLTELATNYDAERGESLEFRIKNENLLTKKAMEKPWTGWGGWGKNRVLDVNGNDITVVDGLWIDVLGKYGVLGLGSFMFVMLTPLVLLMFKVPAGYWSHPSLAPVAALAVINGLYVIDCLTNAMVNPVYMLSAGGLIGVLMNRWVFRHAADDARGTFPLRGLAVAGR